MAKRTLCAFALFMLLVVTPLGTVVFYVLAWALILWAAFWLLMCILEQR